MRLSAALAMLALLSHAVLASSAAPSSSSAPSAPPPDEEAAVLAAMDRFVRAISANDVETLVAMKMPDGMTFRARAEGDGAWSVTTRSNASWTDPAKREARAVRERYWSPTVLIRGAIAVVWAPYEFEIEGKTSHCGIDVFDFVKVDGSWRIANSMWTVEPGACAELRPSDPTTIRPKE